MLNILKKIFGAGQSVNFKDLTGKGAVVVDVRTVAEFRTGHIKNAVNVPLDKISTELSLIKKINKPIIAVCRSGSRSSIAVNILKKAGIEAYNGGAWDMLKRKIA
jgi:rhodanese-related sulfurtransferase